VFDSAKYFHTSLLLGAKGAAQLSHAGFVFNPKRLNETGNVYTSQVGNLDTRVMRPYFNSYKPSHPNIIFA
jgi:hypothetical protein